MIDRLSDNQVLALMQSEEPINRARRVYSSLLAKAEQDVLRETSTPPIEMRRREFEAIEQIAKALGVEL